ncbi:MAG: IS200/IS605 family transposase, partial [Candidatus Aenigmarchaeota archaeon]|nr:IS200/IS605 family transposase [Candidatus Aenigmarchaeota archaeon]
MSLKFEYTEMPHFSGAHTRFSNWYHIVWIPKFHHTILTGRVRDICEIVIRDITNQKHLKLQALNIDPDHIHILVAIPPK